MNLISIGKVKAWELNSISKTIGVCIPKIARENLDVDKETSFKVKIDVGERLIILEPIKEEAYSRDKSPEKTISRKSRRS